MKLNKVEKAMAFSLGVFDKVVGSFSAGIVWEVVGERRYQGLEEVKNNYDKVRAYFDTVETSFILENVIQEGKLVVVIGRGEFYRDKILISTIEASDYYEFDDEGRILKVKSYCITIKN